jgi:hypothetical protein
MADIFGPYNMLDCHPTYSRALYVLCCTLSFIFMPFICLIVLHLVWVDPHLGSLLWASTHYLEIAHGTFTTPLPWLRGGDVLAHSQNGLQILLVSESTSILLPSGVKRVKHIPCTGELPGPARCSCPRVSPLGIVRRILVPVQ